MTENFQTDVRRAIADANRDSNKALSFLEDRFGSVADISISTVLNESKNFDYLYKKT